MKKQQTLAKMVEKIKKSNAPHVARALNGLIGCPEGGWAETNQAISRLIEVLPPRQERTYTANDLICATMTLNSADRYVWRDGF